MDHSITVSGNQVTASLGGKVYSQDASVFRDEMLESINRGATEIKIDMSGLTYIDSTGLGVLITIHKRTKEKNGSLRVSGAQGMVEQLFKRTRLDHILTME